MGVRDSLTGQLYLALRSLVTLKDGPRDEHYATSKDAAWDHARDVLRAWETHDVTLVTLVDHCSPASRARVGARAHDTSASASVNVNANGISTKEVIISASASAYVNASAMSLYKTYLEVLEEYKGGIHPDPQRVRDTPGPRLAKILAKAVAESSLDECSAAIRGAYLYWSSTGQRGKTLADVFTTFRNTGSLSSRISFFAAEAGFNTAESRGLDSPGVRDRLHDVRREIRAVLDLPDSLPSRRRLLAAVAWLNQRGLDLHMTGPTTFWIGPLSDD